EDISVGVDYLTNHLRLLKAVLERFEDDFEIDVGDLGPISERLYSRPTLERCGIIGPEPPQPSFNECWSHLFLPGDVTRISIRDLAGLVDHAIHWCEAIHGAIGGPDSNPEHPTS
ncbi:MAG: hypothetical protein ABFS37_16595, partial [Acidobacteriota bacterium]